MGETDHSHLHQSMSHRGDGQKEHQYVGGKELARGECKAVGVQCGQGPSEGVAV